MARMFGATRPLRSAISTSSSSTRSKGRTPCSRLVSTRCAPAAAGAGEQGGEDALHGALGGDVVGDRHGGEHRAAPAQLPLEGQHAAAAGRDDGVVAGHLGQRPGRAPAA